MHANAESAQTISGWILAIIACVVLGSCRSGTEKLDEAVIYEGPQFRLKLVRYYESLPLHYNGEIFTVQCASAQTANSPGHKTQEPGWVTLGGGGAIGTRNAGQVADRERRSYLIVDERTLVWIGAGFNVSFDACGGRRSWHPVDLPIEMIEPIGKPDYCQPKGGADCRHYDFLDERAPSFEQIQVDPQQGHVSFVVRSKAFRNNNGLRILSKDFGKTWRIESL